MFPELVWSVFAKARSRPPSAVGVGRPPVCLEELISGSRIPSSVREEEEPEDMSRRTCMLEETKITVNGEGGTTEVTVRVSLAPPARPRAQLPPLATGATPSGSSIQRRTAAAAAPATPASSRLRQLRSRQARAHRSDTPDQSNQSRGRTSADAAVAAPAATPAPASAATAAVLPKRIVTIRVESMDEAAVARFLDEQPEFLERYVAERVRPDVLERWIVRKMKKDTQARKTSLSRWKFSVHADKRKMLQDIMDSLKGQPTVEKMVWELGQCVSSAVGVDGCEVMEISRNDSLTQYITVFVAGEVEGEINTMVVPGSQRPAAVQAALQGRPLRLSRSRDLSRYPEGICSNVRAEHVLYQPLLQPDGETAVVLEMWRLSDPFDDEDEEICASHLAWGGMALHYAQLYLDMDKQKYLEDFLLTVVKSIFQDMVSMEVVVTKVMNFAQKLVHADRASLFLVDSRTRELYATVFDVGVDSEVHCGSGSEASATRSAVNEIRFPVGTGIAGHVAATGEVLNIKDAYDDERFNRTVDSLTGYKTKTILCMPIFIRNAIIGVVQMVNKKSGAFTKVDEKSFEMFAVYCGLALHHAKLYDKIKRSHQKYKVALEVLSYHNTCTEEEVRIALNDIIPSQTVGLDKFSFSPFASGEFEKASHTIYMFKDLFGPKYFDRNLVVKFVLTVKKNYRRVPYHNWTHGFSVANCMYNILKNSNIYTANEKLALFIGALCHDLDHRGKNNKFMLDTASPLAAMYSTSTMEHHHFNQTVTILQQEGHNIFGKLSNTEYKRVLGLVKQCILATDLALFFPNRAKLEQLVRDEQFCWTKSEHRALVLALSMTASDLSASAKPWDVQVETVRVIFQEFYEQGDAERAAGRDPIPMMDRTRPEEQAASQVGFLSGICIPCYSLLAGLLPSTQPLLEMCQQNLRRWERIMRDVADELKKNRSIPTHLYVNTEPHMNALEVERTDHSVPKDLYVNTKSQRSITSDDPEVE